MNPTAPTHLLTTGPRVVEDISGHRRSIKGVLRPQTVEEVREIVRWATATRARLYPVSCGNNWGFGSNLPTENNVYVLDLSRLNRIRQLALDQHYVELEPGVTQGQLDNALRAAGRTHYFNVTGAGTNASLLGNALERGIGYFGMRQEEVLDLEVMLADGRLINTGHELNSPFHTGLGPSLACLFIHSTFGIVVSARIRLHKRPECMGALVIRPKRGISIANIVLPLNELQAEGHIRGVPHIGNRQRAFVTFGPLVPADQKAALLKSLPEWTAVLPLHGTKESADAVGKHVANRLKGSGETELITERDSSKGPWLDSLLDLCQGIPSNIALPGIAFAAGTQDTGGSQPEEGKAGLIHVVPTCRPLQKDIQSLLNLIEDTAKSHELGDLPMTVNLANSGMAVVVISVPFRRGDQMETKRALHFAESLKLRSFDHGFPPYRFGLGDAYSPTYLSHSKSDILTSLKQLLDPNDVFAKSKYAPVEPNLGEGRPPHLPNIRVTTPLTVTV